MRATLDFVRREATRCNGPRSAYQREVSDEMRAVYGLDWTDACGDDAPLERAWADNLSAAEFVRWFGEKYGMQPATGQTSMSQATVRVNHRSTA